MREFDTSSRALTNELRTHVHAAEEALKTRSDETIGANQERTAKLIGELETLKEQIAHQIEQATGFALFGAFQARQNAIVKSKNLWSVAILLLVCTSIGVTAWIAYEAQSYQATDLAFFVKLSMTVPLAFAITFCAVQYSRERRLEEEYAFKSSISVSLNPYRDLVYSIVSKDGTADHAKYAEFVVESVRNVFTPPTDKVFDGGSKRVDVTQKTLKQTAEIIGAAAKHMK